FQTINQYPINIPSVPRCYCKRPIVLTRITTPGNIGRWYMACASYHVSVPGAKPKCSFFKWADEVLYDKNDQCFHDDFYKFEQVFIREPTYQNWRKRLVYIQDAHINNRDDDNFLTSINNNFIHSSDPTRVKIAGLDF
ncbi:21465_t:CDS:2, partial [Entrophospora sp. SA101]